MSSLLEDFINWLSPPRPGRDPIRERRIGAVQRMCKREREATPIPFRDLLISLARNSRQARAA